MEKEREYTIIFNFLHYIVIPVCSFVLAMFQCSHSLSLKNESLICSLKWHVRTFTIDVFLHVCYVELLREARANTILSSPNRRYPSSPLDPFNDRIIILRTCAMLTTAARASSNLRPRARLRRHAAPHFADEDTQTSRLTVKFRYRRQRRRGGAAARARYEAPQYRARTTSSTLAEGIVGSRYTGNKAS